MHGEHRHLREHARIAHEAGIASAVATNGMMMDITGEVPKLAEHIEAGRTYLDGSALIGSLDGVVRNRIRMALNGLAMVTVILDEDDKPLGEAWVELMGLPEKGRGERVLAETLEQELTEFLDGASAKILSNDDKMEDALRKIVRQVAMEEIGKKPEVIVVVSRLATE
jgi:ribonuclease J